MNSYDAIVLGTGGVGSAAAFHLAQRGLRTLGLDRFPGGHDRGSSHGQTRIIRQAYFEHPDYVPLLKRTYQLWSELETRRSEQLYHETGLLEVGPPDGVVVPGVLASAARHGLKIERLTRAETSRRFPGFQIPDDCEAVFEQHAGYLLVEQCVLAHLREAQKLGADLRTDEEVVQWSASQSGVRVQTKSSEYFADRLVITAGAWARDLLSDLRIPLRVVLKHLHWYAADKRHYDQADRCPTFFFETPAGYYYGFPRIDARGVKVAEHSGGQPVDDPLNADRGLDPAEVVRVERFLSRALPGVSDQQTEHGTCFYTLTPDEHFLVDRHPSFASVVFAGGLSGHGFKFTPVLGEILADLAIDGSTAHPIEFLSCQRPFE